MESKNENVEKLTFDKIREFKKKENQKKYDRSHLTRYSHKKEEVEAKKAILMEDPIYEYIQYVIDKVCDNLKVNKETVLSSYRGEYITQARYYIIEIVSINTDIGADVMYLINRCKTSYYHAIDTVGEFKSSYIQKRQYEKCFNECKMSNFTRFKKEQNEKRDLDK